MKISEAIQELQRLLDKYGDLEVCAHDYRYEKKNMVFEADICYVNNPSDFEYETIEDGCKCMSCWTNKHMAEPFILIE